MLYAGTSTLQQRCIRRQTPDIAARVLIVAAQPIYDLLVWRRLQAARLDSHGSYHADLPTEDRDVDESRFIVGGEADGLGDAPGHHLRRRMPSVVRIDNLPPQVKHDI